MKTIHQCFIAISLVCSATAAQAQLVTWTFDNLKITERGATRGSSFVDTLTGTIDYDADTGESSNVNLNFTGFLGTATSTSNSNFWNVVSFSPNYSVFNLQATFAGGKYISYSIDFGGALLTNAGGTLNASRIQTSGGSSNAAISVTGSITGLPVVAASAVPEPEMAWLLGAGLLGIAGLSKRRQS